MQKIIVYQKASSHTMLKLPWFCYSAKVTSNKKNISNFRPVSILTTFSKIYERVTKKLIDEVMNKYVSPFISAYRQNYSTQHVLVRLLEEWREGLDNNFVVAGVFMDVSKPLIAFPMI